MPHDHGHGHIDPASGDRRVAAAIGVNLVLTLAQIAGGIVSGSIALIADALHNLGDAIALVIALAARRIARRPSDERMTFGYGRAEVVAALVNYTTLIVLALFLVYEGGKRLLDPPDVQGWVVVVLAGIALIADLVTVMLTLALSRHSMNIRAAFLHNLADALGSVAVIVAGTLILLYDWRLVDPLVTLGIAGYILVHALSEIGPAIRLLMLGAPDDVETGEVRRAMAGVEGVDDVSHVHLWQIDEHRVSVEAHLAVRDLSAAPATCAAVKARLAERFGIHHSTLEVRRR